MEKEYEDMKKKQFIDYYNWIDGKTGDLEKDDGKGTYDHIKDKTQEEIDRENPIDDKFTRDNPVDDPKEQIDDLDG